MKRILSGELITSLIILAMAGLAPNLFPVAQAGYAKLSILGRAVLLPSIVIMIGTLILSSKLGYERLLNRTLAGAGAGLLATLGLEIIRATSFHFGGMPGDMPRLLGVLLTDRFMLGPSAWSDVLGWGYHFWNGAAFGIIFTVILGRRSLRWAEVYGQLIGFGFLVSPAVKSLGIGFMGFDMPAMPITVVLAHMAYSVILSNLTNRWVRHDGWLLSVPPRGTYSIRACDTEAIPTGG